MKIDRLVNASKVTDAFRARLLMLCFFFVLGSALGVVVHDAAVPSAAEQLREYILQYAVLAAEGEVDTALISVLAVYFRYPLTVYLAGFSVLGLLLVPLLALLQGFSLAFSVCCFSAALGRSGILLALASFGTRCILTLPCLLYLAVQAMERSFSKTAVGRDKGKRQTTQVRSNGRTLLCLIILALGVLAELTVVPKLIQLALAGIT